MPLPRRIRLKHGNDSQTLGLCVPGTRITPREIKALKQLSLLGYVLTEREFLAVLTLIRQPGDG